MRICLALLACWVGFSGGALAQAPVVVEIFTSPSCSDAPSADAAFAQIVAENQEKIIALSCALTFLNLPTDDIDLLLARLEEPCNARSMAYARAGINSSYSIPAILLNGAEEVTGVAVPVVQGAIARAAAVGTMVPLNVVHAAGMLQISFPPLQQEGVWDVWVFAYRAQGFQVLTDNDGRNQMAVYAHPVLAAKKAGPWHAGMDVLDVPLADIPGAEDADGYAVLLQHPQTMEIIAAGQALR